MEDVPPGCGQRAKKDVLDSLSQALMTIANVERHDLVSPAYEPLS